MKVICIQNVIDNKLAEKVGLVDGQPRYYRSVTPDNKYIVLGLSYDPISSCYAGKPVIEIKNDAGGLSSIPLFLFDIIEPSMSSHWHVKFNDRGLLTMFPESFYKDFYHDDLSEGVPEILNDFAKVCSDLENE